MVAKTWDFESGMTYLGLCAVGSTAVSSLKTLAQMVCHCASKLLTRELEGGILCELFEMAGDEAALSAPVGRLANQEEWNRESARARSLYGLAHLGSKVATDTSDFRDHMAKVRPRPWTEHSTITDQRENGRQTLRYERGPM